ASDEPSEMDMMNRNPRSISTTVWFTLPPSKIREAPAVRDVRPEATAASWSARSRGKPSDIARRSPSAETTTVWDTPGVLSTKLVINQFRFCAAWLIGLTLTLLVVGAVRTEALAVRFTACVAAPLDTAPQVAQPAPDVLRGAGDLGASLGSGFGGTLDQVGLGHPPRQTRGGHSARLGLPQLRGLLPALVVRRTPAAAVAVVLRRRGRRLLARVPRAARGAARGGSAARKPGVGQLVDGGVGRSRTVEAYAVPLTCVSGLRGFRLLGIRRVLGRVAVLVAVGLRPVVLAAPVVETGERAGGRTRLRPVRRGRLRVRGVRVRAVRREGVVLRRLAGGRVVAAVVGRLLPGVVGLLVAGVVRLLVVAGRLLRLLVRAGLLVALAAVVVALRPVVALAGVVALRSGDLPGALVLLLRGRAGRLLRSLQGRTAALPHQGTPDRVQVADVVRDLGVAAVVETEFGGGAQRLLVEVLTLEVLLRDDLRDRELVVRGLLLATATVGDRVRQHDQRGGSGLLARGAQLDPDAVPVGQPADHEQTHALRDRDVHGRRVGQLVVDVREVLGRQADALVVDLDHHAAVGQPGRGDPDLRLRRGE